MAHKLDYEYIVIGAGPYGLAAASHLRSAGIAVRVFGKPMDFWRTQMPKGMLLRSPWGGSNISDAKKAWTLDSFETARGSTMNRRLPVEDFVAYGEWFQQQALPGIDQRNVSLVERANDGYTVTLDDGETFRSARVVVATGIGYFSQRPTLFEALPLELASHTSDRSNHDLNRFAGKSVIVIGGGQSAMESAALLSEAGAEVEVLMRQPKIRWLHGRPFIDWLMDCRLNPFKAPGKIGPIGINWLIEHPALFTTMSQSYQNNLAYRAIRPAASSWLYPRTRTVRITEGRHAVRAEERQGKAYLRLDDGAERSANHILLGTGYKVSIDRYGFLAPQLKEVDTVRGYPVLNRGFESSCPGLFFVGTTASYSFGPFLRFVAGTQFAATTLTRYAVGAAK